MADLVAYNSHDTGEVLSNGRTLDYASRLYLTTGDQIPCAFNCFMNVVVDGTTGALKVDPPISKSGDHIDFVAEMDLIVGLTACSALQSNGGSFKPIQYRIRN